MEEFIKLLTEARVAVAKHAESEARLARGAVWLGLPPHAPHWQPLLVRIDAALYSANA